MLAVHTDKASAAVTAATAIKQMAPEVRDNMREIAMTPVVSHNIILAHPKMSPDEVRQLREALTAFETLKPAGVEFFTRTGFDGFEPLTPEQLRALDPYVTALKRRLRAP
jgi:ABC-type phosphate/phosphonate transport system substrate-binding protein